MRRFSRYFYVFLTFLGVKRYKFLSNDKIKVSRLSRISTDTKIGDYTYIGDYTKITKAKIGRYCSIADNVTIGPGEHDLGSFSTSTLFSHSSYADLTKKDIVIGNDVWIGVGSTILRGTHIGDGAVVGAMALVNKNIPPYGIAVGVPARVIGFRFDDSKIEELRATEWWNQEPNKVDMSLGND